MYLLSAKYRIKSQKKKKEKQVVLKVNNVIKCYQQKKIAHDTNMYIN